MTPHQSLLDKPRLRQSLDLLVCVSPSPQMVSCIGKILIIVNEPSQGYEMKEEWIKGMPCRNCIENPFLSVPEVLLYCLIRFLLCMRLRFATEKRG